METQDQKSGPKVGLYVILALLLAGVMFGGYYYKSHQKKTGTVSEIKTEPSDSKNGGLFSGLLGDNNSDWDIIGHYNTFPGMAGVLLANGGMETQPGSIYDQIGLKVKIVKDDDYSAATAALIKGDADFIYCTTDALSTSTDSKGAFAQAAVHEFMKVNESRGADAAIASRNIKTPADIRGKKVAVMLGSVSHTLLLNYLENNNMSIKDVKVVKVPNGVDAASAFKSGSVDVALVWTPDDADLVKSVPGAHILFSTKEATGLAADGLLAKESNLKEKSDKFDKLVEGWLKGNALISAGGADAEKAKALFAKAYDFPEDLIDFSKIRFNTLGDNLNFFGLNSAYRGVTGDEMYTRMIPKYIESGRILGDLIVNNPLSWRKISYSDIVERLGDKLGSDATQAAEKAKTFVQLAPEETGEMVSDKQVSIVFGSGSAILTEEAKDVITSQILPVVEGFGGSHIELEGNTDNTGNPIANKALSLSRANAVKTFLVREHGVDPNRFVVVGNGSNKPVSGCETNADAECRARNRRTDIDVLRK